MSNLNPHPSLPARPPAATFSAPPRHNNTARPYSGAASSFNGMMPRAVASRAPVAQASAAPAHAPFTSGGYQPNQYPTNGYYDQQQPGYGTQTPSAFANPYAVPGAATVRAFGKPGGLDPEEEARIAEWNNAYTKDDSANKKGGLGNPNSVALGSKSGDATTADDAGTSGANSAKGKQKTVVRQGGGKSWEDPSLLEWNPLHPRLFVGNLAGEVTDDSLFKAFSKYPSIAKARVLREKHTTKSKSFGFVSFADTDDFFRAAREMEGKYIGSHPIKISRARTEVAPVIKKDDKHGKHGKNNKMTGGYGVKASGSRNSPPNRVEKHSHKNKFRGPKLLG